MGVVVDNIQTGDACQGADVVMVVGKRITAGIAEIASVSQLRGHAPHFLHVRRGILQGVIFLGEDRVGRADHIEQNAKLVRLGGAVLFALAGPQLRAQTPGVLALLARVERGRAHIFGIEEDEVDAN